MILYNRRRLEFKDKQVMKYYLESNDLYIEIPTLVFNQIKLQAEGEYPNENGGMLAGRYSTDRHTVYIEKLWCLWKN